MAFCTQCGSPVTDTDRFCGKCGAPQPAHAAGAASGPTAAATGKPQEFMGQMSSRTASLLCYIPMVGWIFAIVVLASARFRHEYNVRFNAFQGLYLFVGWLIIDWVVSPFFFIPGMPVHFPNVFKLGMFLLWIFMMIKVNQGETYRLPVVGELAERSLAEQR
jgi:uncharacterized membrane protein